MNQTGKRKKKQKGGGGEFNKRNDVHIAEATRIKIQTLLEDFRTSNHKGVCISPLLFYLLSNSINHFIFMYSQLNLCYF